MNTLTTPVVTNLLARLFADARASDAQLERMMGHLSPAERASAMSRPDADFRAFPDVVITCGPRETAAGDANTVTNPTVIVEITSDSTEGYDRGEKSAHYRRIPSLQAYVLVSHRSVSVDVLTRAEAGTWLLRTYGAGDVIELGTAGVTLAVDAIYAGVAVSALGELRG